MVSREVGGMTRLALVLAGILVVAYVVTILALVALHDTPTFVRLLSASLLVPGGVFAALAAVRRRRSGSPRA